MADQTQGLASCQGQCVCKPSLLRSCRKIGKRAHRRDLAVAAVCHVRLGTRHHLRASRHTGLFQDHPIVSTYDSAYDNNRVQTVVVHNQAICRVRQAYVAALSSLGHRS